MITLTATATTNLAPLNALRALLSAPPQAEVGIPASAGADVVKRATINEFGGDKGNNPPKRSFMLDTLALNRNVYTSALTAGVTSAVRTGKAATATKAVSTTAERYHRDIVRRIKARISPANAASTIARKKSNHPLIDTGEMLDAITWRMR
jgi:hypothetical protein